jgi:hypothetical protein
MNSKNLLSDLLKKDGPAKSKSARVEEISEPKKLFNVSNYFKLRENIVNKQKVEISERKKEVVVVQKREKTPIPNRFYDIEGSIAKTKGRTPECIIFQENKYNSHNGFYDFLTKKTISNNKNNNINQNLNLTKNEPDPNSIQSVQSDPKKNEEDNLLKDLRVFSKAFNFALWKK